MNKLERMPALFIGHGSPMNAIEQNNITQSWKELGKTLPTPRAILTISAHWYIPTTVISTQKQNQTIHDFFGFPDKLANYIYPSNGSPEIAAEINEHLKQCGVNSSLLQDTWGLDHGVWSIFTHMYPQPSFPILQLSIDLSKTPQWHFELGKHLQELRKQGIMIIASGNIVHNLGMLAWHKPSFAYDWALDFDKKITTSIITRQFTEVINYHSVTPSALLSVPTPEHFLPLLYILGASYDDDKISIFNQEYQYGSLSMTSILATKKQ